MMPDRETERFFDLWHEHSMSDWRFYGSQAGAEWFRELRHLAAQIPAENWREYALWLVGEAETSAERRDARRMTALALNAFDNHRRLIWA